jgi:hypothetical protein
MRLVTLQLLAVFWAGQISVAQPIPRYVTPAEVILKELEPIGFSARVSEGTKLPLIGSAHVAGKYSFTQKPFLIEGAEKLHDMGYPGLKLWLTSPEKSYPQRSDWSMLGKHPSLMQMILHPDYQVAIRLPFRVIALEVQDVVIEGEKRRPKHSVNPDSDFSEDEVQVHALAKYLLEEFRDREVVFILQNWEGDWMFRGGEKDAWDKGHYPEVADRRDAFVRWFSVRQRAVNRARSEVAGSKARVLHAVEVNQVLATWKGVPTLTSEVLPHVQADIISWSCYDGLQNWEKSAAKTAIGIRQGIETIRHFAKRGSDGMPVPVMLGEIGIPERKGDFDAAAVKAVYDGALAASSSLDVPYVFLWQLYCNEVSDGVPLNLESYAEEQLNGFWLVKPDGSSGMGAEYFQKILKR